MATKKTTTKKKPTTTNRKKLTPKEDRTWVCCCCGTKNKVNFYQSVDPMHDYIKVHPLCKNCMCEFLDKYLEEYEDGNYAFYLFCRRTSLYFSSVVLEGAVKQKHLQGGSLLGYYMKNINSFRTKNGYGKCFDESEFANDYNNTKSSEIEALVNENKSLKKQINMNKLVNSNVEKSNEGDDKIEVLSDAKRSEVTTINNDNSKIDVIRILGYDPFEYERQEDRPRMYDKLVNYLTEDTQNDDFKVQGCVQIVKNNNQINRIDEAIVTLDPKESFVEIGKMSKIKNDLNKSNLEIAKDNGISLNHSNNKSKGAGTLSGIIKELQQKDLKEAEVNMIDIGTCQGMKMVADISNQSILDQIMLNETDYEDMLEEQRNLIQAYRNQAEKAEEELRLFKIKFQEEFVKIKD